MKNIFALIGSAQPASSNLKLVQFLSEHFSDTITLEIFDELKLLPHFDTTQSIENTPGIILSIREKIENADAILFSSPEYIFSIPAGLKNLLEWCVSTTIFSDKPLAIIVAAADGKKAFEEIRLIMQTLGATFSNETCLLINGVKGKIAVDGTIDAVVRSQVIKIMNNLCALADEKNNK